MSKVVGIWRIGILPGMARIQTRRWVPAQANESPQMIVNQSLQPRLSVIMHPTIGIAKSNIGLTMNIWTQTRRLRTRNI
jgi:hypothetical protein